MKVNKLSEVKKVIGQVINDTSGSYPKTIIFNRGIEYPQYRISIEEFEEDFFVDSKGQKWLKVENED